MNLSSLFSSLLLILVATTCVVHQVQSMMENNSSAYPASYKYLSKNYTNYAHIAEEHSMSMTPAELYWSVVNPDLSGSTMENLTLCFAVVIPESMVGWIGIGIAEATSTMPGADIGVALISSVDGSVTWDDYYATGFAKPKLDNCGPSDWYGTASFRNENYTIVEGWRYFRARDPVADHPISRRMEAETHFIFAHGPQASLSYHGDDAFEAEINLFDNSTLLCNYQENEMMNHNTSNNNNTSNMTSGGDRPKLDNPLEKEGYPYFWLGMSNHLISPVETSYDLSPCVAVDVDGEGNETIGYPGWVTNQSNVTSPSYIVGFGSDVDPVSAMYVHHLVVKGWRVSPTCDENTDRAVDIFAAATGQGSFFAMPSIAALNTSRFVAFTVEFHYNNANMSTGKRDSSGIRVYYSTTPRMHMASVIQFGDPTVRTPNTIPQGVWQRYTYRCPSTSTSNWPHAEVTAIASLQHMHTNGAMFSTTYAYPNGTVYREVKQDYYDFHGQRFLSFDEPFVIHRGDIVTTAGTMRVTTPGVVFGLGTQNEMIIDFVMVYPEMFDPVVPAGYCGYGVGGSMISNQSFTAANQLGRTWGTGVCPFTTTTTATTETTTTPTTETSTTTTEASTTAMTTVESTTTTTTTATTTNEGTTSTTAMVSTATTDATSTSSSLPPSTTSATTAMESSTTSASMNSSTSSSPTMASTSTTTETQSTTTVSSVSTTSSSPSSAPPSTTNSSSSTIVPPSTTSTTTTLPPSTTTTSTTTMPSRKELIITLSASSSPINISSLSSALASRLGIPQAGINVTVVSQNQVQVNFVGSQLTSNNQLVDATMGLSPTELSSLGFSSVALASPPADTTTLAPGGTPTPAPASNDNSAASLSSGAIAGIVFGSIWAVLLVIVFVAFYLKKKNAQGRAGTVQYDQYMQESYEEPMVLNANHTNTKKNQQHTYFTPKVGGDSGVMPSGTTNNVGGNNNGKSKKIIEEDI